MKTTFISTVTLWNSPRTGLDKLQADLVKANRELSTGRYTDIGLQLGYKTGQSISLRQERSELDAIVDSNASVTLRLKSSDAALSRMRDVANSFKDALISTPIADRNVSVIIYQAKANLSGFVSDLNKESGGQYIFGGQNTKEKPVNDYFGDGTTSAAKAALDAAFADPVTGFGFSQDDPAVASITPEQMADFLDGPFADLFSGASWQNWSNASSLNIQSLVSPSEKVDSSTNANEKAFRQVAMAYTMASDLGLAGLSDATKDVLISKVVETLSKGVNEIANIQAALGTSQEKVDSANERMSLQKSIFDEKIGQLEAVDPAEAKIRVDQLMTQIQSSYSLTAQLRQLSLINYL